jgi:hypothetical protein
MLVDECSDSDWDSEGDAREGLSPVDLAAAISDFWSKICVSGETGSTDRATLDEIEREVTDALYQDTPDFDLAYSLTAKAMFLMSGDI